MNTLFVLFVMCLPNYYV
uniref:Uncharacterized protein n=1 Tax=Anguilla anguilla TaxID=7936 RepID=A0A0E9UXU4_ANGAN